MAQLGLFCFAFLAGCFLLHKSVEGGEGACELLPASQACAVCWGAAAAPLWTRCCVHLQLGHSTTRSQSAAPGALVAARGSWCEWEWETRLFSQRQGERSWRQRTSTHLGARLGAAVPGLPPEPGAAALTSVSLSSRPGATGSPVTHQGPDWYARSWPPRDLGDPGERVEPAFKKKHQHLCFL